MVEMLCSALSDGEPGFQVTYENMVKRPSNICQFFLVLNPEGFAGGERYGARATHIAEVIGKAKPWKAQAPPRLPGARGHAVERKVAAEGIAMFGNLAQRAADNVAGMLESRHGDGMKAYEVRETTGLDGLVLNPTALIRSRRPGRFWCACAPPRSTTATRASSRAPTATPNFR